MKKFIERFKKLKNERGLTLVELLAVIVILAIVAIIAFVYIGGVIENSKKDAHISNAIQIIQAAKLHEATGGKIDTGISVTDLIDQDYLDQVYDPWTKEQYSKTTLDSTTVTKDGNQLKINNFAGSSGDCTITANEQELSKGDRETLCK